jgi:hypothetical protein
MLSPEKRRAWFEFLDKYYDVEFKDGKTTAKCKHCNAVFDNEYLFALWCHIDNNHLGALAPMIYDRETVMRDLFITEQILCGSNGAVPPRMPSASPQ